MLPTERQTKTLDTDADGNVPDDPVLSLQLRPSGPVYWLRDITRNGRPSMWITMGANSACDIVVETGHKDDDYISGFHCLLRRDGDLLEVQHDSRKNKTFINGVAIKGMGELRAGDILTLGKVRFLARGRDGDEQRARIPAMDKEELGTAAVPIYGSQAEAARAVGVHESTISRWLQKRRGGSEGGGTSG